MCCGAAMNCEAPDGSQAPRKEAGIVISPMARRVGLCYESHRRAAEGIVVGG
jgi:hypothetical protein